MLRFEGPTMGTSYHVTGRRYSHTIDPRTLRPEGLAVYLLLRVPDGFEAHQSAAFAPYASPDGD
jgi:thiamine biosynthesis lipoprotein ApbE